MRYTLAELVDIAQLQQLISHFYDITKISSAIIDVDGNILARTGCEDIYANFLLINPDTEKPCQQSADSISSHLNEGSNTASKCPNRLINCAAPIMIENHHLGTVCMGQFLTEPPNLEYFRKQAHKYGFDEETHLQSIAQVPILPAVNVKSVRAFLAEFAHLVAAMAMERMRQFESEKATHQHEERLQLVLGASNDGFWDWDLETNRVYFSPRWGEILGYSPEDIEPSIHFWRKITHPEDMSFASQALKEHLRGNTPYYEVEHRLLTKSGEWKWILDRGKVVARGKNGRALRVAATHLDISERKRTEKELKQKSDEQVLLLDNIETQVWYLKDPITYGAVNRARADFCGFAREDLEYKPLFDILCREEAAVCIAGNIRVFKEKEQIHTEEWLTNAQGKKCLLSITKTPKLNTTGDVEYVIASAQDITEHKKAEEALRTSEEKFSKVFYAIPGLVSLTTIEEGRFTEVNDHFLEVTGFKREEIIGHTYTDLGIWDPGQSEKVVRELLETSSVRNMEIHLRIKSGEIRVGSFSGEMIMVGGEPCMLAITLDITERKAAEDNLRYFSLHCSLTGVYNRTYFEQEMIRLDSGRHLPVGIIMCDVDGLKLVNDTLGHKAGDELLKTTARIIQDCFREEDVVARIGGDEFAVLLPGSDRINVESACQRIHSAVVRHNNMNPGIPLSISAGCAVSTGTKVNMKELFREADDNMYREKLHSRNSAHSTIVQTLLKTLQARDLVTSGHAERLQDLIISMANVIGLPEHRINDLRLLSQFHDIGKVGVPDSILLKTGALSPEEYSVMQRHSEIGHRIARTAPELVPIADWILKHHERWDGHGYPLGLKGNEIPLESSILAIVDAYDAMTNDRPYRRAISCQEAVAELKRCAGTQFNPQLVAYFIQVLENTLLKNP
ncbi:MAG: PAS domain S-box protein [Syntrophomonas sp.]|nr:PAS domain S-box protein [Syntrophomonas sp.]